MEICLDSGGCEIHKVEIFIKCLRTFFVKGFQKVKNVNYF